MTHYEFEKMIQNKLGLRHRPVRFIDRDLAFNRAKSGESRQAVILGCDGRFWVVCFRDAGTLLKAGYEKAI